MTSGTDKKQDQKLKDLQRQIDQYRAGGDDAKAAELQKKYDMWIKGELEKPTPTPDPDPQPTPEPSGNVDKFGVVNSYKLGQINYDYFNNDRADGKRLDFSGLNYQNASLTAYVAIDNVPSDEVSGKFSIDKHSDGVQVDCYDMGFDNKTGATRWRFEHIHPNYTGNLGTGQKGLPFGSKFVGYRWNRITLPNGNILLEQWQDQGDNEGDKPANNWVKLASYTDDKYKIANYPKKLFATVRIDGANVVKDLKSKWVSVAEIVPT